MSSFNSHPWVDLIGSGCAGACHLHLIIDLTSCSLPLLASVKAVQPAMPWHLLFTGLPEEGIKEFGPLLVRVDPDDSLQRHWLDGLVAVLATESRLLAFGSSWPFEALAAHLRCCLEIKMNGQLGLFRYYDPRTFPLLFSHVLTEEQQLPWLEPAVFWSWLDRDGAPAHLVGIGSSIFSSQAKGVIELSNDQLACLESASDASLEADSLDNEQCSHWSAEQRYQRCCAVMMKATQLGLFTPHEREAYFNEWVASL